MANSFIQLPKDGTGKKTRTLKILIDGQEVHQQIVSIADAAGLILNLAKEDGNLATLLERLNDVLTELQGKLEAGQSINVGNLPLNYAEEDGNLANLPGLSIPIHDYIELGYTGENLTSVIYKIGGVGGTTVATLTLVYTGDRLDNITKS